MLGLNLAIMLSLFPLYAAVLASEGDFLEKAQAFGWVSTGPVPEHQHIELTFWLKLTHTHELKEILSKVSDPQSPDYGHYLTKDQADSLTKPTAEHIAVVKKALEGEKLKIGGQGATISATVNISFAEKLLGGRFTTWCHQGSSDSSARADNFICVVRNPTAKVPKAIRAACDIIAPIDDPFPPTQPLPGPIISRHPKKGGDFLPVALAKVQQLSTRGCCFSYGFGALMKPCCLETHPVDDVASCRVEQRMGGASNYVNGKCPATAEEAAQIKRMTHHSTPRASMSASIASAAQASQSKPEASTGCCYSIGYGARMEACCLETKLAGSDDKCDIGKMRGGATGFNATGCPNDAAEADTWLLVRKSRSGSVKQSKNMPLLWPGFIVCGGVIAGIFFAAKRRQDTRSTPFLHNDGVE
mmetsp:Transcript_7180/g.11684  ORF Transcript_7180/g.11684 Transcript_7180/m.11684 type:complete len:415 (+) Transcript_7180:72-1316(+)